jgi:citrate lyase subunit beta/citryl-CoA lyase
MLFVPADSEKKLAKAITSAADALILDLEDSVASSRKASARICAADFIKTNARQNYLFASIRLTLAWQWRI